MYCHVVVLFMLSECCAAVIYKMNVSEYNRMPPLFHLDDFDSCLLEPGGTYCVMDVDLYGDSELMRIIRYLDLRLKRRRFFTLLVALLAEVPESLELNLEYSAHTVKHFNHTQIHRGVCVTSKCKQFLHEGNKTLDLTDTLEACLNDSLWKEYQIEGKLANLRYCKRENDRTVLDESDIIVAVVYILLIMLNIIGSFYDNKFFKKEDKTGNPYLMAFSIRRNWARLVAPVNTEREPRLERLKVFHGMRTMTMFCVLFSHTVLIMAYSYVANPYYIETAYEDPFKQILFNGSLVTHTFFVMSAFLMAYNFQLHAEKHSVSLLQWPKGMLLRWLRLTPTYALILGTICTLMRYLGSGPVWDLVVTSEADGCRQYWWAHIFYINNYVYEDALCAPQTWYLAADTQLFCLGLLVCVLARRPRSQVFWLVGLFMIALVTSATHTYFQDLNAVVIQTPESYRNLYATDDTFRLLYIRGHTNLSTYTLGLAGGFLTYYWQNQRKDFQNFKKHRWAYWLLFPAGVAVILSGGLFYMDGGHPHIALKILYAIFYKPIFQTLVASLMIGAVFKFETAYRAVLEWRGFTWMGRVSYSAFLLHTLFQRGLVGSMRTPVHISDYFVMMILAGSIFLTYMSASVLWLCVEAPLSGVIRAAMAGGPGLRTQEPKGNGEGNVEPRGESSKNNIIE